MSFLECDQIKKGCATTFRFTAYGDKDPITGIRAPFPLTGERVRFALKRDFDDEEPILVLKDSDNGITEVEILSAPNDNQALIKILSTDVEDLETGCYCRSIEVTITATGNCVIPVSDSIEIVGTAFNGTFSP